MVFGVVGQLASERYLEIFYKNRRKGYKSKHQKDYDMMQSAFASFARKKFWLYEYRLTKQRYFYTVLTNNLEKQNIED